jgi:hypothetical protein
MKIRFLTIISSLVLMLISSQNLVAQYTSKKVKYKHEAYTDSLKKHKLRQGISNFRKGSLQTRF